VRQACIMMRTHLALRGIRRGMVLIYSIMVIPDSRRSGSDNLPLGVRPSSPDLLRMGMAGKDQWAVIGCQRASTLRVSDPGGHSARTRRPPGAGSY
jgi:hypothetical protein